MQLFELLEAVVPDSIAFAPDGRILAVVSRGNVFALNTLDGTVRTVASARDESSSRGANTAFTVDESNIIAHHSPEGVIKIHDLDTGVVRRDFTLDIIGASTPGPDGRLVYATRVPKSDHSEVEIVRWNPLTGKMMRAFGRHNGCIQRLAVSTDEKWVIGSHGHEIRVWNLAGKEPPKRATRVIRADPIGGVISLALSADGGFFAAGILSYLGGRIYVGPLQSGELWSLGPRGYNDNHDLVFHPSRPLLAFPVEVSEVAFYDAMTRTELKRYGWGIGPITAIAFSPDGLRCAAAGAGKVVVWDVDV